MERKTYFVILYIIYVIREMTICGATRAVAMPKLIKWLKRAQKKHTILWPKIMDKMFVITVNLQSVRLAQNVCLNYGQSIVSCFLRAS